MPAAISSGRSGRVSVIWLDFFGFSLGVLLPCIIARVVRRRKEIRRTLGIRDCGSSQMVLVQSDEFVFVIIDSAKREGRECT